MLILDKRMDRKAQVTLFVIIAVIVVASMSIFFMFRAGIVKAPISTEQAKKLLSSKSENLRDYTSKCIERTADDYFQKVMLHGGYYTYENLKKINYKDNENIILLYNSDQGLRNDIPSLSNICGSGFEDYMANEGSKKLDDCLKDFRAFKKDMDINPSSERKIIAECEDESIIIKTDWLMKIERADASSEIQQKNTKLLIPLKRMWTVANDILIDESKGYSFAGEKIEEYILNHKNSLENLRIRSEVNAGTQTIQYITSKPYRNGEEQNVFIFAIDKFLAV